MSEMKYGTTSIGMRSRCTWCFAVKRASMTCMTDMTDEVAQHFGAREAFLAKCQSAATLESISYILKTLRHSAESMEVWMQNLFDGSVSNLFETET